MVHKKQLSHYFKNYYLNIGFNVLFNLLSSIFGLFSLLMTIPFLRVIFKLTPPPTYVGMPNISTAHGWKDFVVAAYNYKIHSLIHQSGYLAALEFICVTIVVVFFFKNLFRYLAIHTLAPMRTGVVKAIRQDIFHKTLMLPVAYFTQNKKGDTLSRMSNDVQEIEFGILHFLEVIFKEPINIIATLTTMIIISPKLTLFVFLMLPFSAFFIGRIAKSLKKQASGSQQKLGQLLSLLEESISGMKMLKMFNAQHFQEKKFEEVNNENRTIATSIIRKRDLSSPLSEFLGVSVVVILLWFGGRLVLSNNLGMSPEVFITFMIIFTQIISPSKAFSNAFYFFQKGKASFERVQEFLEVPEERDTPNSTQIVLKEKIQFEQVSFLIEDREILESITFTLEKGKTTAIVGESGAGKTTILNLLCGFVEPTSGSIVVDNQRLTEVSKHAWRNNIALVSQEPILFHDTILNNLLLAKPTATKEEIETVLIQANAKDFVLQQPQQLQTIIGDRGMKLSGGEQQRLSLARALLKYPEILLLDEATSNLDSASEKLVQEALQQAGKNRTTIVIAHRLSTIRDADKILVFKQGKLVESGNHHELIALNGEYFRLVNQQSGLEGVG